MTKKQVKESLRKAGDEANYYGYVINRVKGMQGDGFRWADTFRVEGLGNYPSLAAAFKWINSDQLYKRRIFR